MYLSGLGLTTNRKAASGFVKLDSARANAQALRRIGARYGITKVAIVTRHDPEKTIAGYLGARRKNPASREVENAARLFEEFTGHRAEIGEKVRVRVPSVGVVVGELDGVLYTTVRDGKRERYVHQFRKRSRPMLVAGHDGASLHVVGGRYRFTDRGIVDK